MLLESDLFWQLSNLQMVNLSCKILHQNSGLLIQGDQPMEFKPWFHGKSPWSSQTCGNHTAVFANEQEEIKTKQKPNTSFLHPSLSCSDIFGSNCLISRISQPSPTQASVAGVSMALWWLERNPAINSGKIGGVHPILDMFCTQFFCIVYYCILHTQKRHVCASISGKAEGLPTKPHLQLLHGFSKVPCLRPEGRSWPVDHVEIAAHPNSARFGIFEYPRQVNISLGTFTSLGNLLNLNRERKKKKNMSCYPCYLLGWTLGGFYQNKKCQPKKNTSSASQKSIYPLIFVTGVFGHIRNFLPQERFLPRKV